MEAVRGPKIQIVKLYIKHDNRPILKQKLFVNYQLCKQSLTSPSLNKGLFKHLIFSHNMQPI